MFSQLEFTQLRRAINASVSQMADLLGFNGKHAAQKVRAIESGKELASLPVQRLAKFMQQGVSVGVMDELLPAFLLCVDIESAMDEEWVFHTRYPRFLAIVSDKAIDNMVCASIDNVEWLVVAMWIDQPLSDASSIVEQAAAYFADYTQGAL